MSEQPKEELKVKDLLVKLQILTNGLLEERNKTKSYLSRLKEYEEALQKKDLEISDLTKEKFELKSKLTLEKTRKSSGKKNDTYFSFFNTKGSNNKISELEAKINQLNFEIKNLTSNLMEERESFDQQKIRFQTMLTLQSQQMSELKKKYEDVVNSKNSENSDKKSEKNENEEKKEKEEKEKKEKEDKLTKEREIERERQKVREREKERERENEREKELERLRDMERQRLRENAIPKILLSEHKEKIDYLKSQFNSERDGYEKQLGQMRNELREEKDKNEKLNKELKQLNDNFEAKSYENGAMKSQVNKLNDDLIKLRNEMRDKQLATRLFQVERIRKVGKQSMVIIFKWNKNKNKCEMIFKREKHIGGKNKEDIVNILDVNFKINEKNADIIDMSFKVSNIIII